MLDMSLEVKLLVNGLGGGWVGGWVAGWFLTGIKPLRGPTCMLEPARSKQSWIPSWARVWQKNSLTTEYVDLDKIDKVLRISQNRSLVWFLFENKYHKCLKILVFDIQ